MTSTVSSPHALAPAEQWRDGLVRALITPTDGRAPAGFLGQVDDTTATVVLVSTGELVAVVTWPLHLGAYEEMRERLSRAIAVPRPTRTHVVLVGGGDEAHRVCLELSERSGVAGRFSFYLLGLDGSFKSLNRSCKPIEAAVRVVVDQLQRGEPIQYLSQAEIDAGRERFDQAVKAEGSTRGRLDQRPSTVTTTLIAAIVTMYIVQWYFGDVRGVERAWADDGKPGMFIVQMGALWGPAVLAGQWWRLVSCMFLHGSVAHIATNAWSLWALGRFVEKVIGSPRYLVLYTVAGIAGSVASMARGSFEGGNHISVGASGAIFGLMGGLMALTYMKSVLPQTIAERLRRSLWPVLILNIAISMVPGIDASAHFGGAFAGIVLAGSGLLTRGMPPLLADGDVEPRSDRPALIAAAIAALVLVAGVAAPFVFDAPWQGPQ